MNDSLLAATQASDRQSIKRRDVERYRLRKWELMTLEGNQSLERVLSKLQERYDILTRAPQLLEAPNKSLREAVKFYTELGNRPIDEVFRRPEHAPSVLLSGTDARGAGEVTEACFFSRFEPLFEKFNEEFVSSTNNRRVFARVWRQPHGCSKGTIIAIPGWYMTDPRLCAIALLPGFFFSLGYNVVVYELPYTHRRMTNARQVFPSSNLVRTNEGIFQAIFELRQLSSWLESQGEVVTGVLGASFGGYLAALWSSLDSIKSIIAVSPVSDLLSTVEGLFLANANAETLPALRMAYERIFSQCTREELAGALAVHSPLRYENKCAPNFRLLITAADDLVVGDMEVKKLQTHWGEYRECQVPGGHFGQLCKAEAQQSIRELLDSTE